MLAITEANTARLPTLPMPGMRPQRFRIRQDAVDAALLAMGPDARPEFEFNVIRLDGVWIWKPTEQVRAVRTGDFQSKINGGARRARAIGNRTVKTATVTLELAEAEAVALATLCRRIKVEDLIRLNAGPSSDTAVMKLASALRAAGVNPE
jgi:hypothetical protein